MTQDEQWLLKEKWCGEKSEGFFTDCERLRAGEPLAYVIGHIPFLHTTIHLDSKPLIPRVETEFWVEKAIVEIQAFSRGLASFSRGLASGTVRVLDLCAGSGCVGVSVLKAVSVSRVDFVEIDTRHHATIQKNLEANGVDLSRAHVYDGNLFEHITETYDFILTNPPYIADSAPQTDSNVLQHEPHLALFSGTQGLDTIFKILTLAPQHLKPNGVLYIEHDPEQSEAIVQYATSLSHDAVSFPDQYNRTRYTRITRRSTQKVPS